MRYLVVSTLLLLAGALAAVGVVDRGIGGDVDVGVAPDLVVLLAPGLRADAGDGMEPAFFDAFQHLGLRRYGAAYASSPAAHTSLGSLLTGRTPSGIPLCSPPSSPDGVPFPQDVPCTHLPDAVPTLPGVLALYGYETAIFGAGLPRVSLFPEAFGTVEIVPTDPDGETDWDVLGEATSAWWSVRSGSPRLIVVVVSDLDLARRPALWTEMGDRLPRWTQGQADLTWNRDHACVPPRPPLAADRVRDVTGREARETGEHLAALLERLDVEPDRARFVTLSSLHGVSLDEWTGSTHYPNETAFSLLLLNRTVQVPLALSGPGVAPGREDAPVGLVDVLPTLLARMGAVTPAGVPGRDLLGTPAAADTAEAYVEFGDMLALRRGRWFLSFRAIEHLTTSLDPRVTAHLLEHAPTSAPPKDLPDVCPPGPDLKADPPCLEPGKYGLHDVVADPLQRRNLLWVEAPRAMSMWTRLATIRTSPMADPSVHLGRSFSMEIGQVQRFGYW